MDVEIEWVLGGGFAYVAGDVIVQGAEARDFVADLTDYDLSGAAQSRRHFRLEGVLEPLSVIGAARAAGFTAQPNHVFFAHSCSCCANWDPCCGQSPCNTDLSAVLHPNPFWANPFRANPFWANPFRANPFCGNPFRANPFRANANLLESSAQPASEPEVSSGSPVPVPPRIVVLDTGLADPRPPLLQGPRFSGDSELPDTVPEPGGDSVLDPVAGHGTFIAGLIERYAPGCEIEVDHVVTPIGAVSEWDVAAAVDDAAGKGVHIINLSFGGPIWAPTSLLDEQVASARQKGVVVVASAGNEGWCRPSYPAAFDSVIAVGALGPDGPASFTNYGSWVQACAPGVDLVSTFFEFDGPATGDPDPDNFEGWATWSGTSFAAPMVVAALANYMIDTGGSAVEAVTALIDDVTVPRIPCLGSIVGVDLAYPPEDEPTS